MAYSSNLLGDFWTSYKQGRATGGRPLTTGEMRGLMEPIAASEAQKAMVSAERDRQYALYEAQLQMARDAEKRQKRSMRIGNVLGAITAPLGLLSMGGAAAAGLQSIGGLLGGGGTPGMSQGQMMNLMSDFGQGNSINTNLAWPSSVGQVGGYKPWINTGVKPFQGVQPFQFNFPF